MLVDWNPWCECVRACSNATMCGYSSAGKRASFLLQVPLTSRLSLTDSLTGGEKQQRPSRFLAKNGLSSPNVNKGACGHVPKCAE